MANSALPILLLGGGALLLMGGKKKSGGGGSGGIGHEMRQGDSGPNVRRMQRLICAYHASGLGWAGSIAASFQGFDNGVYGPETTDQVMRLYQEFLPSGIHVDGTVATPDFISKLKAEIKKRGVDPNKAANIPCGSTEYPKL